MVFLYTKYIGYTYPFNVIITTNPVPIKPSSLSKLQHRVSLVRVTLFPCVCMCVKVSLYKLLIMLSLHTSTMEV